jgi:hypothetical protein
MKKLIKITESQYKRIFLSEQDNKDTFCGKSYGGKYNDKGSYVIESKDGKTYKFAKKYSVEQKDYKYGLIIDGNSKTKFYYKCDGDTFFINGGEKEKLSEKLNKISSNEATADNPCLKKGERLYRVNEKVYSDSLKVKPIPINISGFGCMLDYTGDNGKGVKYNLKFAEDPNKYNLFFEGSNFKINTESDFYKLIKKTNDENLIKLLNKNYSDFKITGKYSLDSVGNVGIYYATIYNYKEKNGKNIKLGSILKTKQDSSFFKQIIESFEASDYAKDPGKYEKEKIKKSAGDKYEKSATKIKDLLDGFTNDEEFIDIYKEIYKYNCNELKLLKKYFGLISDDKKSLRNRFNKQTTQPGWKEYINDMSDYLNVEGCNEDRRKKLKSNIDKMVKEESHVEKELRDGGGFKPSDKTSSNVYTKLKSNPTPKYIADTIKNSKGTFNDNEAWAQAAFESIRDKSTYDKVSKSLGKDPYEFVKDFISTNKEYHTKGKTIDTEYKRITGNNP